MVVMSTVTVTAAGMLEGAPKPAHGARAGQNTDFWDMEEAKGPFPRPQEISASEFDLVLCITRDSLHF